MSYLPLSLAGWGAALASLLVVWMLGALVLELAGVRTGEDPAQMVVDIAAGVGGLTIWTSLMVVVEAPLLPVQIGILLSVLVGVAKVRDLVPRLRFELPDEWPARLVWCLGALGVLGLGLLALRDRLWWDGWMMWSQKAVVLLEEGGLPHEMLTGSTGYQITHPDYPLGLTGLVWLAWSMTEVARPVASSVIGWALWALSALFVGQRLRTWAGDLVGGLAFLGLVGFWPLLFYAQGGTADILVGLALVGIVASLLDWLTGRIGERQALATFAVFLLLATISKNEGWLAALASGTVVVALGGSQGRLGRRVWWSLTPLLFPVLWSVFMSWLGVGASFLSRATILGPEALLDRALTIWASLRSYTYQLPWSALFPLMALGLIGLVFRKERETIAGLWLIPVLAFLGVCLIYLLIPIPIDWWLSTSQHRVIGQLVPAFLFLSVVSLPGWVFRRNSAERFQKR